MLREAFNWEKITGVFLEIWYALGVNLCFILCSLPVLLYLLFVGPEQIPTNLPLFLLCLLPEAPALCGVFSACGRLVGGIEGHGCRDFFRGYKRNWKTALKLGAGQLALIFVLWTNIRFFSDRVPLFPVLVISLLLFLLTLLLTPNLYFLASAYEMGACQTGKMALAMTIGRPGITLGEVAAMGVLLAFFEILPGGAVLIMASLFGILVSFMNKRILEQDLLNAQKEENCN